MRPYLLAAVLAAGALAPALAGPPASGKASPSNPAPGTTLPDGRPVAPSGEAVAQFGLLNPLDAARGIAIRSALSEFGQSINSQLPLVLSPSDAYPTEPLPGPPFSPSAGSPNVAAALRASKDGTIVLPPGDYAFSVEVFCMKAHAGSPYAQRYLVAPLQGSCADGREKSWTRMQLAGKKLEVDNEPSGSRR
jgi:hypothetical protein